ncbi:carbohydrate ABC transporter permease [Micromonospora noduli]|uniref:Alpha-glucoside transport system permease protein n AglG n=1 Tax=Micromonospora noduli TaxID=709876 RepID=A0A328N6D5_9ACTN|nr:carbohydrate ABC transporter permease [Micromonospora noduli]KAB1919514.1 carbohydrate ABC transporter permease [Micromonospora noduli]RAN95462.1 Alpha-glucoside transport system permease protein n AglG [Micromonospora noduli]RAO04096.1 Alpha-glucoside transport system permease protein n AglG [Micromonospora noduli]RAO15256.1 Alpha-glucoside transport system permease protein n AglG [Micromonospora noduli]RAO22094.1 Alpha-glucoside transport system permease protein n AglG [Micromonospora nod
MNPQSTLPPTPAALPPKSGDPSAPAGSGHKGPRSEVKLFAGLGHVALAVWAVIVIVPILWTFLAAFKNTSEIFSSPWTLPAELRWENFGRAWTKAHVGRYFLNSVIVVSCSTFLTMLLGSMAAYVLARYKFWGNRAVYFLFVSGLAFPVFLALVPLFFVVKNLGLLDTHTGVVLVYSAYSLPFTVFFLAAFFKTLPSSVAEAGMIDGCGHTRLFFQVMMPMAKPGLISVTIFNIIGQWAQYQLPLVLLSNAKDKWVLTQGIADISVNAGYEADWSGLFAALTIAILPMIIVYAVFQRQIQAGLTSGAVK